MNKLAPQIIIDILTEEMQLDPKTIWLRDQNRKIPDDKTMFLVVGLIDAHPMSNVTYMKEETVASVTTQHEINEVMMQEFIEIDIMSRNNDALLRKWEVVAALQSFYAQQQQELNNFKIFRIPGTFVNTSGAEGGSNINRYSITATCFVWYRKDKILKSPLGDYYDDFNQRVDDEQTIGTPTPLFEFEITPDTPPPP